MVLNNFMKVFIMLLLSYYKFKLLKILNFCRTHSDSLTKSVPEINLPGIESEFVHGVDFYRRQFEFDLEIMFDFGWFRFRVLFDSVPFCQIT